MAFNLSVFRGTPVYQSGDAKFGAAGQSGGSVRDTTATLLNFLSSSGATGGSLTTATIEAWVRIPSGQSAVKIAFGRLGYLYVGTSAAGVAIAEIGAQQKKTLTSTATITDGNFHHVALVINPTTATMFVDGASVGTITYTSTTTVGGGSGTDGFVIGDSGLTTSFQWPGAVDEVRVSSSARYSAAFTPPTGAFTSDASTVALYHLDGDANDTATAVAATVPGAPSAPTGSAGDASANLTTTSPADTGGAAITDYVWQRSSDSGSTWTTVSDPVTTALSLADTGLTNGTAYVYRVAAVNTVGQGSYSGSSAALTPQAGTPSTGVVLPTDANIVYSPYTWLVGSGIAKTINSGAYFRTLLAGSPTALTLTFDLTGVVTPYPELHYRIDSGAWVTVTLAASINLTLPSSSWGKRLLEVVVKGSSETVDRWVSQANAVKLTGITTTPTTVTTAPVTVRPLRVVIFGDSITEGIRTLALNGIPSRNDAMRCWTYALGDALGAEVGVVGFGNQGITVAGNGNVPALPSSWGFLWSGQARDLSTAAPDVLVTNIGHNDNTTNTVSAMTSLLNAWLAALPVTSRVVVINPFSGRQAANLQAAVAASNAPWRVTWIDTTGWWSSVDASDGVHPYGYAGLTQIAPRAAAAIVNAVRRGASFVNRGGAAVPLTTTRR